MSPLPDLSGASDQDVVAWARQGREEACRELVRRYGRPVLKLIYRIVRDQEVAKDLTQETLVKAFKALASSGPELKFSAWIFRIANNTAIDYLRRKELTPLPLEISPDTTPPGKIKPTVIPVAERTDSAPTRVRAREFGPAFEQALRRLRPDYRRCVVLRVIEERSYARPPARLLAVRFNPHACLKPARGDLLTIA